MKHGKPSKYSKSQTDSAGLLLRDGKGSQQERDAALEILSEWRASHSYPLHIFKKRLKRVSEKIDSDALTAQRLKRVPSIIKKLRRHYHGEKPTMKLTQMQDIAGCRAVMSNIDLARKLYQESYIEGEIKHKKVNEKDYISLPKDDGYRSIHLIYRYNSDKQKGKAYNGLLVEVQIRSKIQHIWATAVETVGFFTHQALKSNEGKENWKSFFKLMSSAFALMEGCSPIAGTPADEKKLYSEIEKKESELKVITKLTQWAESLKTFEDLKDKSTFHFYLLQLDTIQEKLLITAYTKRSEEKALADYAAAEKKIFGKKEFDAVLVGADDFKDLKEAYPNYFLDTKEFISYLKKILKKVRK